MFEQDTGTRRLLPFEDLLERDQAMTPLLAPGEKPRRTDFDVGLGSPRVSMNALRLVETPDPDHDDLEQRRFRPSSPLQVELTQIEREINGTRFDITPDLEAEFLREREPVYRTRSQDELEPSLDIQVFFSINSELL
jgi:hypothetical protein